jgi:YHS domain-containing protein
VQGPEIWLNALQVRLPCAVDPEAPAAIDVEHRALVNWEAYFVSGPAALAAFRQAPWEYCGVVTDPVSRARFRPSESSPRRDRGDHPFFFENEATLAAFDENPESYETPRIGMVPMK